MSLKFMLRTLKRKNRPYFKDHRINSVQVASSFFFFFLLLLLFLFFKPTSKKPQAGKLG